jgi:hypothetical protein
VCHGVVYAEHPQFNLHANQRRQKPHARLNPTREDPGESTGAEVLNMDSKGPRVRRSEDDPASASPDLPAEGLELVEKSVH